MFLVFLITTQAQNQSDFDELAGFFNEIDLTIPNTTYSFVDEGDLYVLEVLLLPEPGIYMYSLLVDGKLIDTKRMVITSK